MKRADVTYNAKDTPTNIYFTNGSVTKYVYSSAGEKLGVEYRVAAPNVTVAFGTEPDALTLSQTMYAGSRQYLLGGSLVMEDGMVDRFLFDGGYAKATAVNPTTYNFSFYYYNQDHLGNNREVVDSAGTVKQITHYYPFGTPYADPSTILNASLQPYKYNGKELDKMHGLNTYDYGARQYNPVTARWDRMDPLCEKYYSVSPYAYCHNNPVMMVDPDGRDIVRWDVSLNRNGNTQQRQYTFNEKFEWAMRIFCQTEYGKTLISSFTPAGENIFGISGNGKYAKYRLDIQLGNYADITQKTTAVGTREGSFGIYEREGEVRFSIFINTTGRDDGEILETIAHEFALHGSDIDEMINIYENAINNHQNGYEAVKKFYDRDSGGHNDHINLSQENRNDKAAGTYLQVMDEITKKYPQYKDYFIEGIKDNSRNE